jgi:hypothetical protein
MSKSLGEIMMSKGQRCKGDIVDDKGVKTGEISIRAETIKDGNKIV